MGKRLGSRQKSRAIGAVLLVISKSGVEGTTVALDFQHYRRSPKLPETDLRRTFVKMQNDGQNLTMFYQRSMLAVATDANDVCPTIQDVAGGSQYEVDVLSASFVELKDLLIY
jgi:hypothetical protein